MFCKFYNFWCKLVLYLLIPHIKDKLEKEIDCVQWTPD